MDADRQTDRRPAHTGIISKQASSESRYTDRPPASLPGWLSVVAAAASLSSASVDVADLSDTTRRIMCPGPLRSALLGAPLLVASLHPIVL